MVTRLFTSEGRSEKGYFRPQRQILRLSSLFLRSGGRICINVLTQWATNVLEILPAIKKKLSTK